MSIGSILGLNDVPVPPDNPKPFVPVAHYSQAGDQLKVFWDQAESFADALDDRERVTVLRAYKDNKLITGAKIWGLSEVVINMGAKSIPPLDRSKDEEPALFKPYAAYSDDTQHADALFVRWQAGKTTEHPLPGARRIVLLRDATDRQLVLGFILPGISAIARR